MTKVIPGPDIGSFGIWLQMRKVGPIQYCVDLTRKYGDIVQARIGSHQMILLSNPQHFRHIFIDNKDNYIKKNDKMKCVLGNGLLTSEGPLWRRQRRLLQPPFNPSAVGKFYESIRIPTQEMLDRWEPLVGTTLNVNRYFSQATMSAIGRALFNRDLLGQDKMVRQSITYVLEFLNSFMRLPLCIPTPGNLKFKKSMQNLDRLISSVADEYKGKEEEESGLLSYMLRAKDPETGESMDALQLRDEMLTIFTAGHETTAQSLTWTFYLLDRNPEVLERLRKEVTTVLDGRFPSAEDARHLIYTQMVIEESLRLYPVAWHVYKTSNKEDVIGGYRIPANASLVLCHYLTQRSANFWKDPDSFIPERFVPHAPEPRTDFSYFPFGTGSRFCLGSHFAMLEMKLMIAAVVQKYRLRLVQQQTVEFEHSILLRPRNGMPMKLERV